MRRQPAIAFILVTVLIDVMGIGLLLPVIPALVGEFTASRDAQTYWYGALMVTFGLAQFLCSPLLGALSDRYGRRPVLLASITGLGTMFFLSAIVTSLPALLATRVLGGALAANFSVANAYVADITTPGTSAPKSFGMIGAAFGIGFIVGPAIGGTLGSIDIRLPFYAAAALSLVNVALRPASCCRSRCRASAARPSSGARPTRSSSLRGPGAPEERRRAGGRDRAGRPGAVHPARHLGAVHGLPFRLGAARERAVAVRRRPRAAPWCRACCSAWLLKRIGERRLVLAGMVVRPGRVRRATGWRRRAG